MAISGHLTTIITILRPGRARRAAFAQALAAFEAHDNNHAALVAARAEYWERGGFNSLKLMLPAWLTLVAEGRIK